MSQPFDQVIESKPLVLYAECGIDQAARRQILPAPPCRQAGFHRGNQQLEPVPDARFQLRFVRQRQLRGG